MVKYTFRNKKYEATGKAEKLFEKWATIGTSDELKRNKLTLCQYHSLPCMLHEIAQSGKTRTCSFDIAEWFIKRGCKVTLDEHNINFEITI